MKIATLTMNPAIDKSSAVTQVVAEWKLRCEPPTYEPGGGVSMCPGPCENWVGTLWLSILRAG